MTTCNDNLAKKIPTATFSPTEVKKLYNSLYYICNLTNQTLIKIPFGKYKGYGIASADVKSMNTRLGNFIKNNGKNPNYVNILAPKTIPSKTTKKGEYQLLFESVFGKVSTIKEVTDKIRNTGYEGYLNAYKNSGIGDVKKNINRLKNKVPMNCCDLTAIIAVIALEMGYSVDILQIQCIGVTHLLCRVKGKELGNWNYIDSAPMASKTAPYCSFGNVCWCANNGKPKQIVAVNPKWYMTMYLNDFKKFM
ncbi:MAG: hypothetical protein ISP01_07360 [Methanobrevibacter arboriphilus]|uniref:Uncharacterized protein n=1 Tax=Methanobrevibacter arboriphilus TaxID=39441 RepID=A0A843APN4_METAZ|nr:hypothetical protein [Methanobrevibacter arboriphilus]MBF4469209.1 hypothetical protein [Methanobrevibacter arboriphilus]